MTALRFEGVEFTYPGEERPALRSCSLEAKFGAVTWLTGALGAGTTTALLVAAGLAPRHTHGTRSGAVRTLGTDPSSPEGNAALAGRVAFVMSTPATQLSGFAETVAQEVAFAPANLGWPRERIAAAVEGALAALRIAHLAERDPATLSGGEMQRAVLAAMLVLAPELWLLDEPASALDAEGRALVYGLLRTEAKRGAGVVIASEDADGLFDVADEVVVLQSGRAVLTGPPDTVLRGERIWEAGAGSTAIAALARAAGRDAPRPLTVEEGVTLWTA